jgi:hypothetical protein
VLQMDAATDAMVDPYFEEDFLDLRKKVLARLNIYSELQNNAIESRKRIVGFKRYDLAQDYMQNLPVELWIVILGFLPDKKDVPPPPPIFFPYAMYSRMFSSAPFV